MTKSCKGPIKGFQEENIQRHKSITHHESRSAMKSPHRYTELCTFRTAVARGTKFLGAAFKLGAEPMRSVVIIRPNLRTYI